MFSYWEQEHFFDFDYAIIGSGITGLSTACSILEQHPTAKVVVLERGFLPSGASTKNAGFACIGSFTEKMHDLNLLGETDFLHLIESRIKGLELLRKRVGDKSMDFQQLGGYELILEDQQPIESDQIEFMNRILSPIFKQPIFSFDQDNITTFGFRKVHQLVKNAYEGQINTGLMMQALLAHAQSLGAVIYNQTLVKRIEEQTSGVSIQCTINHPQQQIAIKAKKVAICTNAFIPELLPQIPVQPGRGQVICTSPIPNLQLRGVFSFDEGYYYFRNIGNRVIFGGGRNLDFEGETTTQFETNSLILTKLHHYLKEIILPQHNYSITHEWSGIMAFSNDKKPLASKVTDKLVVGGRLNGMGVAIGSLIGKETAKLLKI